MKGYHIIKNIHRAALSAALLVMGCLSPFAFPAGAAAAGKKVVSATAPASSSSSASVKLPDFAYPRDVADNAAKQLQAALASGRDMDALTAAVQLSIARNLISTDSVASRIAIFDDLSRRLKSPYSNLALLLEARLYCDIYQADRWNFNNRSLPQDSLPADPAFWDRNMFASRVRALVGEACAISENSLPEGFARPLADYAPILSDCPDTAYGFTLYDFIIYKGVEMLGYFSSASSDDVLPFGNMTPSPSAAKPSLSSRTLLERLADYYAASGLRSYAAGYAMASLAHRLPAADAQPYVRKAYAEYSGSEADVPLAVAFYDLILSRPWNNCSVYRLISADRPLPQLPEGVREFYNSLLALRQAVPSAPGICEVDNIIKNFSYPDFGYSLPELIRPDVAASLTVGRRNVGKAYVLLYRVPDSFVNGNRKISALPASGRLLKALPLPGTDSVVPAIAVDSIALPPLSAGYYALVASATPDASGVYKSFLNDRVNPFCVTSIEMINISRGSLYVVDALTQKPVKGAKVRFVSNRGRKSQQIRDAVSDANGHVAIPFSTCQATASWKGSSLTKWVYDGGFSESPRDRDAAEVFTDLAIYKPGQEVGFSTIVYRRDSHNILSLCRNRRLLASLCDANGQVCDSLTLTTSAEGRAEGRFTLPESGMLGSWSVRLDREGRGSRREFLASQSFEVADYKAPSFFVTVDSIPAASRAGEPVDISGRVMTYSGMPLADASVDCTVSYVPWWFWRSASPQASYSTTVTTDSEGKYRLSLSTASLKGTPYEHGAFRLNVAATSAAGETQQADPVPLNLGNPFRIVASLPDRLKVSGDSVAFNIKVVDMLGHPARQTVSYRLTREGQTAAVSEGEFVSPKFMVPAVKLPSGRYTLSLSLPSDSVAADTVTSGFILWRANESRPPVETALWLPSSEYTAVDGDSEIFVKVGNYYSDGYILCVVADSRKVLSRQWLRPNGKTVSVSVPAPADGEKVWVTFLGMRDFKFTRSVVTVNPASSAKKLTVESVSFRNRLSPDTPERWSFRFLYDGKPAPFTPAMAVMSNKALDAIVPFVWDFNPSSLIQLWNPVSVDWVSQQRNSFSGSLVSRRYTDCATPSFGFNFYGWSLYPGGRRFGQLRIRGSHAMADGLVLEENMVMAAPMYKSGASSDLESAKIESEADAATGGITEATEEDAAPESHQTPEADASQQSMRSSECPLAFFRPMLTSDADGRLDLDFKVPDFNTTWKLQLLGYTSELKTAMTTLEAVASKPVMVSATLPGFLRTYDNAVITATLFNNSDRELPVGGRLEFYDVATGSVLGARDYEPSLLAPAASRVVSLDFTVPAGISQVGIRAYASAKDAAVSHSDGEQTVLPVLPASQPVVESAPFYIAPDSPTFSYVIPALPDKNARTTLQYCDNPVWYCITSLPALIVPDNASVMALANALYGNATASSLMVKYPQIRKALAGVFSSSQPDSLLVSSLQKDASLKTFLLNNTPWVNDAAAETMRLSRLNSLLDASAADRAVRASWERLLKLRHDDGGWAWCPGMESSRFMTVAVLSRLGNLLKTGSLPASLVPEVRMAAGEAVAFCDADIMRDYYRNPRTFPLMSLLNYLYVRSFLTDVPAKGGFDRVEQLALNEIASRWKKLDIRGKATAAILLDRKGRAAEASDILRSLSQYASYDKAKGMWFDNLSAGYQGSSRLLTTTRVLDAYAELTPSASQIDLLRQWLILNRQTLDWGAHDDIAETVQSLLSSGSDWSSAGLNSVIAIDGKILQPSAVESLTGSFSIALDPSWAGKTLTVARQSAGPAWGGVISQYVAPMREVKAASVPDLRIEKNYWLVTPSGEVKKVDSFKKGDRIRVSLSIFCGKDMNYLAISDERPACLVSSEQISDYLCIDSLWAYREVRLSATNFFFSFFPKGKHIVSYDCFAQEDGSFAAGVASAQCQYAPLMTARSAGAVITVK